MEIATKREMTHTYTNTHKIDAFWCIEKMMLIYGIFVLLSQQFIWIPEVNRTKNHRSIFVIQTNFQFVHIIRLAKERSFSNAFLSAKIKILPFFFVSIWNTTKQKQTNEKKWMRRRTKNCKNKSQFNYLTYNQRWALWCNDDGNGFSVGTQLKFHVKIMVCKVKRNWNINCTH